jgi:hypothetical protein
MSPVPAVCKENDALFLKELYIPFCVGSSFAGGFAVFLIYDDSSRSSVGMLFTKCVREDFGKVFIISLVD